MSCNDFRRQIYHFQADELAEPERLELQAHLDACPECARRLAFEDGFLRALKSRLEPVPAPPGLETRIRASLADRRRQAGGAFGWLRAPWFAATAASLLLALLVWQSNSRGPIPQQMTPVQVVSQEVVVVDRDCDRAGRDVSEQRRCRAARHLNALKLSDGTYWQVSLDGETYRDLVVDPEMRGHRMRVEGQFFPAIRTIRLDRAEDLGMGVVAAAHLY